MAKEKILFILHLPPPVHGSSVVGKQIYDSDKIKSNFECFFINLSTSKNVNDIGGLSINKIFVFFRILLKIFTKLMFGSISKVYLAPTVTKNGFFKDYIVVLVIKLFRVEKIYHLHNKGVSKRKKSKFIDLLYSSFFKNVKVILLSKKMYNDISDFVSLKDVYICPNGINNEVKELNKREIKDKKTIKLLFLSNLIESKGVYVLLQACEILLRKKVDFTCNFIGGEKDVTKEMFKDKVNALGLENNVFYHGKKYNEEKKDFFLDSDIFVFPTFYIFETFGLVNIEAMMYSLPVISTDEGGISDIIINNETGFIVEKKNPIILAEKIFFLIDNPEYRLKMGTKGRKRFLEYYTINIFEQRLIDILKNN